jgi:hypothetical protein
VFNGILVCMALQMAFVCRGGGGDIHACMGDMSTLLNIQRLVRGEA